LRKASALLLAILVAGVCTIGAGGCGGRQPNQVSTRPNIVLVTIDTLRADRIRRGFTPTIDALADAGLRFDNARSAVPLTLPSHVTLMTGLLPVAHGVRQNGVVFAPRSSAPTLAQALRGAGYRTAAFVGAYVLDRRFGLGDGFEIYDDRIRRDPNLGARLEAERPAREVVDAVLPWLNQTASPFFLWVHLYDPHAPYEPPSDFWAKAGGNPYDGEVAYADAQIARVIDAIRARGLTASTVVAIAGDHGEGLGDHGEPTHGMLAYDATLKVPLVLSGGTLQKRVVSAPVSLADLAPSLLRLAGLTPAQSISGVDLLSATSQERDVYAETFYPRNAGWHPLSVMAGERWKLILSSETELYDIAADRNEQHNVAAANPGVVQGMTTRIGLLQASAPAADAAVPADAAERLRALGYVSGSPPSAERDRSAPNPARVIESWAQFEEALSNVNAGRAREALPALKSLAVKFPDAMVFQTTYGRALKDAGQAAEALAVYRRAVVRIQDASLYHDLAVAARAAGKNAEAERAEQAALALEGNNPAALNGLGLLQAEAGRAKEAAASFERAATLDPSNASYWTNLGNARRELADVTQAEAAYKRALDVDPTYADAANGLGVLLVQGGKPADAIPWFERALKSAPDLYEARLNLGIALQESGQRDRAAAVYQEILIKAPPRFARERRAAGELLQQVRK
jgi:arylsulfatase A-like enzyme/tetratricopeptide (TPR) repeat protein